MSGRVRTAGRKGVGERSWHLSCKHSWVVAETPSSPQKRELLEGGVSEGSEGAGRIQSHLVSLSFSPQSEVDTEYSDPFDAQPHPPPLDDGYMEPYDAQRVVSGE